MTSFINKHGKISNYKTKDGKNLIISPKSQKTMTPRTFLKHFVYENLPPTSYKKKKLMESDFEIPNYNEYKNITMINYNCKQLKSICRYYKLKKSGNKKELQYRLWNHLKYSYYSIKIQKLIRNFLIMRYKYYKGDNIKRKATNDTDFMTLKSLKNVSWNQQISYEDKDGFKYTFDICSLFNLYKNGEEEELPLSELQNPYNRKILPWDLYRCMRRMIFLSKVLKMPINLLIENNHEEELSEKKKMELHTQGLFQTMDSYGYITDVDWFLGLPKIRLIRLIRELIDIWEYRAQISNEAKRRICPPTGHPFTQINQSLLSETSVLSIQKVILNVFEKFIRSGLNEPDRKSGTIYVLGALTIVSENAANSLPWLYETFMVQHHPNNN
jgi:hypothetical protein